jgi:hypothetical protein
MKERMSLIVPLSCGLLLLAGLLLLLPDSIFEGLRGGKRNRGSMGGEERIAGHGGAPEEGSTLSAQDEAAAMLARLLLMMASKDAKANEAVLTFKDAESMKEFLARADAAGLKVLGTLDKLNAVRVGYDDLRSLRDELLNHAGDYSGFGANYYAYIPDVPSAENRPQQSEVGFGEGALAFMGVKGDFSSWGKGVTIAILDSGISTHPAFANGRVRSIDIGMGLTGTADSDGHATAVASLAGGTTPGATGVAPASGLMSIRVTNSEGVSDLFTLAQGIMTAVDNGAQVINISLGSYQQSSVLTNAITYAYERGSVIVAAAGNDQAPQLTWPAADPRVVSVGAVDALGQQVSFSNSGENLASSAPGLGLSTAWPGNQIVSFDGTSGSSPLMAGAIAAVMSQVPGITAFQAAEMLTTYSADAGAPGRDPAFGYGTVDVGYALNHSNPNYTDTSISSQYFNAEEGRVEFVVQNRSGHAVEGMTLSLNAAGAREQVAVPALQPGERWAYNVQVSEEQLNTEGQLTYTSQLRNPNGLVDQNPGNNGKASVVFKVTP